MSLQFGDKDAMWDHVEDLIVIELGDISQSYLGNSCSHSITEGHQVGQKRLVLSRAVLTASEHLLVFYVSYYIFYREVCHNCSMIIPGRGDTPLCSSKGVLKEGRKEDQGESRAKLGKQ